MNILRSASGVQMKKSKARSALSGGTGTCVAGEPQVRRAVCPELVYSPVSRFTRCQFFTSVLDGQLKRHHKYSDR